jgi:hypothetical protein
VPSSREVYYLKGRDHDAHLVDRGLDWLVATCILGQYPTAYLVVPTMNALTDWGVSSVLNNDAARALANGQPIEIAKDILVFACAEGNLQHNPLDGPVLALYCTPQLLQRVHRAVQDLPLAIVSDYVPGLQPLLEKWDARPIEYANQPDVELPSLSNPIAEQAMCSLSRRVNVPLGLSHPLDYDAAIHAFRILKANGELIPFDQLPDWHIARGWSPENALQVTFLGRDVYDGKRIPFGESPWEPDQIGNWRSRAESASRQERIA